MRRTAPFLLAVALSLLVAVPARADLFTDVLQDYVADGRVDACKYKASDLKKLKDITPVDQNAYSADFVAALDDAISQRAAGSCNKRKQAEQQGAAPVAPPAGTAPPPAPVAPAPTPTPAQTPQQAILAPATAAVAEAPPTPGEQPAAAPETIAATPVSAAAAQTDSAVDAPFPVLALAILLGILALGGLLVAAVRWMAWEPAWAERARHATAEAGWRASSTWAEFADFVRFGR